MWSGFIHIFHANRCLSYFSQNKTDVPLLKSWGYKLKKLQFTVGNSLNIY